MTAFYYTHAVTWLGGLIVDLKVTSHLGSSWETMKKHLQWRKPPKEGNEFSWLQVGGSTEPGSSQFFRGFRKGTYLICESLTSVEIWICVLHGFWCEFFRINLDQQSENQTCHDGRSACTDLNLQLTMITPSKGHVTKIYGFLSTSTRPLTTKPCRIVDKNALTVTCSWPWRHHL